MKRMKKNLRRGFTVIELIIVVMIIGILSGYTLLRYQNTRYKNAMDSDKLKIMTKVNNTNIEARFKTEPPKYIKFQDNGIMVISSTGDLEIDTGFNTKKLGDKNLSIMFECGEDNPILKECPLVVFEGGDVNKSITTTPFPFPNSVNLKDEAFRKTNGYIEFNDGNPDRTFTVYVFDEKGMAKSGIVFTKRTDIPMLMEVYNYIGSKNNTIWKKSNMKANPPTIDSNWEIEKQKEGPIKIEIR